MIKEDLENNNYSEKIMQADTLPNEEHTNSEAQQNSSDEGPAMSVEIFSDNWEWLDFTLCSLTWSYA